jgi:integrase
MAIRFSAYGKRRCEVLGTADDGWSRRKAEAALMRGVTPHSLRRTLISLLFSPPSVPYVMAQSAIATPR